MKKTYWAQNVSIISIYDFFRNNFCSKHIYRVPFETSSETHTVVFIYNSRYFSSILTKLRILTRLRVGQPEDRESIPGRAKRFFSSSQRPCGLWVYLTFCLMRTLSSFPGSKMAGAWSWSPNSSYFHGGAIHWIFHNLSWPGAKSNTWIRFIFMENIPFYLCLKQNIFGIDRTYVSRN
jgi:hypothetical protein